jgi:hypothetical protein
MKYLFLLMIPLMACTLHAQSNYSSNKEIIDTNAITINKDPRIDLLIKKQAQINEETSRDSRRSAKGFRLLVLNTIKRDDAINAKTAIYKNFPELKAYLLYQSPYFKLKVGNFKTKDEAEDYRKKLNQYFPSGVYIMQDTIEVNPEKFKESEWDDRF